MGGKVTSLVELITNSLFFVKTNTGGRRDVEHKVLVLVPAQKAV